ncbi:MAG: oligosaccharide repeat unit polymerase [Flavobacteriaceae bacterium]|nr:oligosaccharide repeat unit polymerase [Flavobacteriaceae bacterium]
MSTRKIKIAVFLASFVLLTLLIKFANLSKEFDYYNMDQISNDSLFVQVKFKNNTSLDKKVIQLYYSDSTNSISPFSEEDRIKTLVNGQVANFKFSKNNFPKLLRFNFDRSLKNTIGIENIIIYRGNKKIDLNLEKFRAHPSVRILKQKSNFITINLSPKKNINYNPYIFLETPIYTHKLTFTEIFLIATILTILSFLITALFIYLLNFKTNITSFNSILLFLLIISLLFKEHWISKTVILIAIYTIFLLIRKKIVLKKITFYGFLLFLFFVFTSLFWSVNVENSLSKSIGFLPFLIIPVWVSSFNSKIRYEVILKYVGYFFIAISAITILMASIRYNTTHLISEFYYHSLTSPLSTNAIYISILYLMVFLFNLYFILRINQKNSLVHYVTLIIIFIYILLLSSKLISVLLFISTIIMFYSSLKFQHKNRKLVIIAIAVLSILFFIILKSDNNISKRFDEILKYEKIKEVFSKSEFGDTYLWNGLNLRLLQLRAFYDIEKDSNFNAFLGVGLGNGQELLNNKYKDYKLYTGKPWEEKGGFLKYNFHNQYSQTLIELGVIGFLLLIYILYNIISISKNNKYFLAFYVIFIFILVMFTESILERQKGIMFFVVFPLIAIKVDHYIKQNMII